MISSGLSILRLSLFGNWHSLIYIDRYVTTVQGFNQCNFFPILRKQQVQARMIFPDFNIIDVVMIYETVDRRCHMVRSF